MAENFRLYCLDNSGHIGLADWIEAETVDEAIEKARRLHPNARKSELWLGKALVAEVNVAGELVPIAKIGQSF